MGADGAALDAIAGTSTVNITATGASFAVDQAINTSANVTIKTTTATAPLTILDPITVSNAGNLTLTTGGAILTISAPLSTAAGSIQLIGPTVLDPPITTSGGNIIFTSPVTLSADTTVNSGAGATIFESTIDGAHFLTVSGATVNFDGNIGSTTPLTGLAVTGPISLFDNVTTNNGSITFNSAVTLDANVTINSGTATTTFGATVDSNPDLFFYGEVFDLTATAGAFQFGGALGGTAPLGAVSLTSINDMTLPSITATTILAQTTGASADLTLGSGTILTASDPTGTAVTLAAGLGFINEFGPGAIVLTGAEDPPSWLIYSANPADDVFGELNSDNTAVWNSPFGGTVTATGDRYVFAFQPAITVTAGNLIKIYGQDVTALVAADYTIGGVQPGVAGAYLGDTASAVYSGAPSLTSLGSPARAPVTGSPYSITVGLGSLVIDDGYGFVANSTGTLTVDPLALTYAVANASSTYGTTATLGAATLTGVLPGDTVDPTVGAFSGATPITLGPRTPVGAYSEDVTALSNPNYSIAPTGNTPGVLTISPLALTYSVTNAASTYGTTATLGTATLTGVLPGDTVDPTVGAFSGATPVALGPRTAAGLYSEEVEGLSNPNYSIASSGNTPGTLTISPLGLTYSVANASSTYGTTATLGAATLTGVLPGDTVDPTVGAFSGATPIALGPRTATGLYSEEVTGLSNPNYSIASSGNTPGTLTISPLGLTYSVANASSTYGTTATLGAATLTGVLPGDMVDPTVGAFSGATPVALGPRTAAGLYSEEVTGLSNPNYTIAPSGNSAGTLTIDPRTLSYAVANATSIFGTFPILGPATCSACFPAMSSSRQWASFLARFRFR